MRGKKKKKGLNEIDYWQPTSDLLISLLFVLMLVILLLGLYLMHSPDLSIGDPWPGDAEEQAEGIDDEEGDDEGEGEGEDEETGDETEGGETTTPTPTVTPTLTPTPAPGSGNEPDEGIKSAVYVMLVDAETGRTVKEEGVVFELYSEENGLQILNTYYPEKIAYRDYETTESGTFYLPEKVFPGGYYLRELTEASGYEIGEDQHFVIDKLYDWPEPFLVEVPVYPSHSIIRVKMLDKNTGEAIGGGSFNVLAAEDILTQDGTLRYRKGQIVDTIFCDEEGYGESGELFLGSYSLSQDIIPQYYAGITEELITTAEKKTDAGSDVYDVLSEKTRIGLTLTDELETTTVLEGVPFEISGAEESRIIETDKNGKIELTDLEKNTDYRIRQAGTIGDYLPDTQEYVVHVGANGRIGTQTAEELELTNRLIRVTISLKDALLGSQIGDVNLALYDDKNELVRTWTTSGVPVTMNDLHEGGYRVVKDGDKSKSYLLYVENTAEPQELVVSLFTWRSAVVLALGIAGIIFLLVVIIVFGRSIRAKHMVKKEEEQQRLEEIKEQEEEVDE